MSIDRNRCGIGPKRRWLTCAGVTLCAGLAATALRATSQTSTPTSPAKEERARLVFSKALPQLNGAGLKVTLVEVNYAPGEASHAHSHPCAVVGYVVAGAIRTQVKGEPVMIYKAGESFYEAPNGIHLISANASSTEPAKLLAYLLCDHEAPLSVDVPEGQHGHRGGQ